RVDANGNRWTRSALLPSTGLRSAPLENRALRRLERRIDVPGRDLGVEWLAMVAIERGWSFRPVPAGDGVRRIAPAHGAVRRVRRREHARRHLGMGWDRLATIGCGPCRPRPREHDLRSGAAGARPVRRGRNLAAQRPGLVAYPRPRPDGAHRGIDLRRGGRLAP